MLRQMPLLMMLFFDCPPAGFRRFHASLAFTQLSMMHSFYCPAFDASLIAIIFRHMPLSEYLFYLSGFLQFSSAFPVTDFHISI